MSRDRILAIIAEQGQMDPADLDLAKSHAELGLDSLALVESIFALEEAFDITIPYNANDPTAADGFDISTLGAMVGAVERLIAAK